MNTPDPTPVVPPPTWERLLDRYFDGVITPDELQELCAELRAHREAARAFARAARMDAALHTHYHRLAAREGWNEIWAETAARLPRPPEEASGWRRWADRARERRWWVPASAVLAHAALILILVRWAVPHFTHSNSRGETKEYPAEIAWNEGDAQPALDSLAPMPAPESPEAQIATYQPEPLPSLPSDAPDPFADILIRRLPEVALAALRNPAPPVPMEWPREWMGRTESGRAALLRTHLGAMADSVESASVRAHAWLADRQQPDGSWGDAGAGDLRVTALSLLAFLARGESPLAPGAGPRVTAGLRWLLQRQQADGWFGGSARDSESHALALAAVSEAYSLSRIPSLRAARDRALAASLAAQQADGLWTDRGGYEHSLAATAYQMMALHAARMYPAPELDVDAALRRAATGILSLKGTASGSLFAEARDDRALLRPAIAATRTAAWALHFSDVRIPAEVQRTLRTALLRAPDRRAGTDVMETMIIASASFHAGGRVWTQWRDRGLPGLLAGQSADGSWNGGTASAMGSGATACAMLALSACVMEQPRPLRAFAGFNGGHPAAQAAASTANGIVEGNEWSQLRDLNPRPAVYKTAALPLS